MNWMIRLEGFAGCDVEDAVREIADIATRTGTWVKADVNGIEILWPPGESRDLIWERFQTARSRKVTFFSSNVMPGATTP